MDITGFIQFNLTLGDIELPVEMLVIPYLGRDKMLIDNATLRTFRGVLD